MTKICNSRIACNEDIKDILSLSGNGELYALILKHRFSSLESLLAEVGYPGALRGLFVCSDGDGAVTGWACCFKFNERTGYSGVAQMVMDFSRSASVGETADDLYGVCKPEWLRSGVHTIVSFVHGGMAESMKWHHAANFDLCGEIQVEDTKDAASMYVFSKKIS